MNQRLPGEVTLLIPPNNSNNQVSLPGSRRMTIDTNGMPELAISRRPSACISAIRRQSTGLVVQRRLLME